MNQLPRSIAALLLLALAATMLDTAQAQGRLKGSREQSTRRLKGKRSGRSRSQMGMMMGKYKGVNARENDSHSIEETDMDASGDFGDNLREPQDLRAKDDKDNNEFETEDLRRSYSSKIQSRSEGEFLGAQRFNGIVCLCDVQDFRYRNDYRIEAYDLDLDENLGFCLDLLTGESEDDDNPAYKFEEYPILIMTDCDNDRDSQKWNLNRLAQQVNNDNTAPLSAYHLFNPTSGIIVGATMTDDENDWWPLRDNDKYKDEDEEDDIFLRSMTEVQMDDERFHWVINDERFFLFENSGFLIDDDIFGFLGDLVDNVLPLDVGRDSEGGDGGTTSGGGATAGGTSSGGTASGGGSSSGTSSGGWTNLDADVGVSNNGNKR